MLYSGRHKSSDIHIPDKMLLHKPVIAGALGIQQTRARQRLQVIQRGGDALSAGAVLAIVQMHMMHMHKMCGVLAAP